MKTPSLFLAVSASLALFASAQQGTTYSFGEQAVEAQTQVSKDDRTSYIAPATPSTAGSSTSVAPVAGTPAGTTSTPNCSTMCMAVYKPVCGSDFKTYGNPCELSVAQCLNPSAKITKLYDGECAKDSSKPATPTPSVPEPKPTTAAPPSVATPEPAPSPPIESPPPAASPSTPKCPGMCTANFAPVCGSDGKTYSNACELAMARCKDPQRRITKASDGACGSGTSDVSPIPLTPGAGVPDSSQPGTDAPKPSESLCEKACRSVLVPVCGSDGITYNNACELSLVNCKSGNVATVTIAKQGACGAPTAKEPASTGDSGTTSTTSTTTTTTASASGTGKDGYLRGAGKSPYQGQ